MQERSGELRKSTLSRGPQVVSPPAASAFALRQSGRRTKAVGSGELTWTCLAWVLGLRSSYTKGEDAQCALVTLAVLGPLLFSRLGPLLSLALILMT